LSGARERNETAIFIQPKEDRGNGIAELLCALLRKQEQQNSEPRFLEFQTAPSSREFNNSSYIGGHLKYGFELG
jgi:hypothetical protein